MYLPKPVNVLLIYTFITSSKYRYEIIDVIKVFGRDVNVTLFLFTISVQ